MPSEAVRTPDLPTANTLPANAKVLVVSGGNTYLTELQYLTGNSSSIRTVAAPANGTSTSIVQGAILTDGSYLYVATANNVLKRVILSAF